MSFLVLFQKFLTDVDLATLITDMFTRLFMVMFDMSVQKGFVLVTFATKGTNIGCTLIMFIFLVNSQLGTIVESCITFVT